MARRRRSQQQRGRVDRTGAHDDHVGVRLFFAPLTLDHHPGDLASRRTDFQTGHPAPRDHRDVGMLKRGIRCDDDGLLAASEPGVQLTWMDARVGDRVITPARNNALHGSAETPNRGEPIVG
jgi:hypothetical protein